MSRGRYPRFRLRLRPCAAYCLRITPATGASRRVYCSSKLYMRPELRGPIGCLAPALSPHFCGALAVSPPATVRRTFRYGFILPRALRPFQSSSDSRPALCNPRTALRPSEGQRAPPLEFRPSSRHQLAASTNDRSIQLRPDAPSLAFHAPSTVYSATNLAGLFHPAATSRVHSSGDYPSPRSL